MKKKKIKKKNAFTLVEILVAIAIIGILVTFASISIVSIFKSGKKGIFENNVLGSFKEAEYYLYKNKNKLPPGGLTIDKLELSSKKFVSGKFSLDENDNLIVIKISDGEFCAHGNKQNLTIEENCIDKTAPTLTLSFNVTTNSITIIANTLPENEIDTYQFKIDAGNYVTTTSNIYTFSNLSQGEYKITVRVTNTGNISVEQEIIVSTNLLDKPNITAEPSGPAKSKTVKIRYLEKKEGYVLSYKIASDPWVTTENLSVDLTVNENLSIIAKVFDGINSAEKTFVVGSIDNEGPILSAITLGKSNVSQTGFTITRTGNATDASGLATNAYTYQISTDNVNWTTKCTTDSTSCNVSGISMNTTYNFRICAKDILGNESCMTTQSGAPNTSIYIYIAYLCTKNGVEYSTQSAADSACAGVNGYKCSLRSTCYSTRSEAESNCYTGNAFCENDYIGYSGVMGDTLCKKVCSTATKSYGYPTNYCSFVSTGTSTCRCRCSGQNLNFYCELETGNISSCTYTPAFAVNTVVKYN